MGLEMHRGSLYPVHILSKVMNLMVVVTRTMTWSLPYARYGAE